MDARGNGKPPPGPPPVVGIISKTLVRSPVTRRLFPARLRCRSCHDIVFLGEDFFHVKQIDRNGRLHHIGTKTGFRSPIRSAGIIGQTPKPIYQGPLSIYPGPHFNDEDPVVPEHIPPQFLVLALEDPPELRFLIVDSQQDRPLRFQERIHPLPAGTDFLTQPGRLIAVDPNSRAFAVAACEKNILIYRLKSTTELSDEYSTNKNTWDPIMEDCSLKIDGSILCMDFLHMSSSHDSHIALVLIVATNGRTRVYWYIWNFAEEPLRAKDPLMHPLDPSQPIHVLSSDNSANLSRSAIASSAHTFPKFAVLSPHLREDLRSCYRCADLRSQVNGPHRLSP